MKKILLVSGDSFTADNFVSSVHPELDTSWPMWPELLAKKLDMECVNVAESGAGNDMIFERLLDKIQNIDKKKIGLVIAAWSQSQRRSWQESKLLTWKNNRCDEQGDIFYWVKRTMRYWHMFQILCERYNLPYKQIQMICIFDDWLNGLFKNDWEIADNKHDPKPDFVERYKYPGDKTKDKITLSKMIFDYEKNINTKNFIMWPALDSLTMEKRVLRNEDKDLFISRYDAHPTRLGQEKIMEFIHERLG